MYDPASTTFIRNKEHRTRVMWLTTSGLIINVAPSETHLEDVRYVVDQTGQLTVTDDGILNLDINEFGLFR